MTTEEIENLANNLAEEYERYKDELTVESYIKRVIEITNLHWQEKTRWIPVEERLPVRKSRTRQILGKDKNTVSVVFISCSDEGYLNSLESLKREFTHWKEID